MKRFFIALCVFCLTAVFASAEEPELIERPLSWTIDSIRIVWNIEEKQTENYEWRSISDRSKTSSVDNSNLSRDTNTTTDTSSKQFSEDADASVKGGVGFDRGFFASWGLQGSAGMSTGLGWKKEDSTANTQQNEWVKSENTTAKATESEDSSKGNQTLRYNRKLLFTVNFVNHTDAPLVFTQDPTDKIPVYCGNEHIGNAQPTNTDGEFVIRPTGEPFPCQFEMALDDSGKMKLLESIPEIRIAGSQIKISNKERGDAFTQSIQRFPHFTVRLTADGASRGWEFRYNKKSDYTLQEVLETINDDCEDEDLFELGYNGTIISVAGYPVEPTRSSQAFVLLAWNGEPVTDLKDLQPRKNCILDVILVSRALLETRQSNTLTALIPFRETLETWVKEGQFEGKYLAWNLMDKEERLAEIKRLAASGDNEVQRGLESQRKAGDRKVLTVDGIDYAFCWCPAGEFMMGSPEDETNRNADEKQHKVTLKGFWLLETEVTQEMWQSVMGNNPSYFQKGVFVQEDNTYNMQRPVENVSWEDCQKFCQELSKKLNRKIQLPTEAQWEYACRAGSKTPFNNNSNNLNYEANYNNRSTLSTVVSSTRLNFAIVYSTLTLDPTPVIHPDSPLQLKKSLDDIMDETVQVAKFKANAWGLYDMHGNVWEWCSDYYDENYYAKSPTNDPENRTACSSHVIRGGSWNTYDLDCRSACRSKAMSDQRNKDLGLRVLLVPSPEE